jgi:hypothetical protein
MYSCISVLVLFWTLELWKLFISCIITHGMAELEMISMGARVKERGCLSQKKFYFSLRQKKNIFQWTRDCPGAAGTYLGASRDSLCVR